MDCKEARLLIPLSIDSELDGRSELALAEHLDECADCRTSFRKATTFIRAVRASASRHEAPPQLRQRVIGMAGGGAGVAEDQGRPWWKRRPSKAALVGATGWAAATALSIVLVGILPDGRSTPDRLTDELVSDHARAIVTDHLADIASSDQHTVKPWLSSRLDYSPPVRDFAAQGFPLVGGRLDYLDRRVVAVLVYRRRQHLIDVFVEPGPVTPAVPSPASVRGYNVLGWTGKEMTYRAVSDVERGDLLALQQLIEQE
jgi:anti-sigma factor RsiW